MLESIATPDKRPGFHVSVTPRYDSSPSHNSIQNQIILKLTKKFLSILRGYIIDRMVITTMFGYDVNGNTFAKLADGDQSFGVKTGGMIKRFMQFKGGIKYVKQSGDFKLTIAPPKAEEEFVQTQAVKQVMKYSRRKGWQAENPSALKGYWTHPSGPPYVFFHGRKVRKIKQNAYQRESRWGGLTQITKTKLKIMFNKGGQPPREWVGKLPQTPFNVEKGVYKEIIEPFYNAMFSFLELFSVKGQEAKAIGDFFTAVDRLAEARKPWRTRALRTLSKRVRAVKRKEDAKRRKWESKKARWAEARARKMLAAEDAKTRKYAGFLKKWNIRSDFNKIKAKTKRKVLRGEKFIKAEQARTQKMVNFSRRTGIKTRFRKIYGTTTRKKR